MQFLTIWKQNKLVEDLIFIFHYFNLVFYLKDNIILYFIFLSLSLIVNYLMAILLLIMAFRIKNNKLNILWPISFLKFSLPFFSYSFFSQNFLLLISIFDCKDGNNNIINSFECSGIWYNVLISFVGIGIFLLTAIALITNILYFKPIFIITNSDLLNKTNSFPDTIFIITKIGLNLLFCLDREVENEHWAILFISILFAGINAYFNLYFQNRANKTLNILNNIFSLILVSGFISLFIGKMFQQLEFTGSIYFYFSCIILIFVYILFYKNKEIKFISINYKEINNSIEYLYYISKFHKIIKNKNNSRNNYALLDSLIFKFEEKCLISDCPLKKYIENLNNGIEYPFLLNQFCDKLFQYGIAKFPNDIYFKLNYSIFLISEMNYEKKALMILNSIKKRIISFDINYYIYRTLRIIKKWNSSLLNNNNSTFDYRKKFQDFKILIKKLTVFYYDFLSLLLNSKFQNNNSFNKIHKIGLEIMKNNPKIEEIYNDLINIKTDNIEIIKLYSDFVEGVLCDEEKLEKCQNDLKVIFCNQFEIHEKDFANFDIEILNEKGNLPYIIVSGHKSQLGKIIDLSLNVLKIFGYIKNELVGQHINILMPRLFHKVHESIIMQQNENHKLKYFDEVNKRKIYLPDFMKKEIYGISKMKFLIELNLNIYFVKSETNKLIYIVEIENYNPLVIDLIKNINPNSNLCVLTDENFLIQSFTPNCIENLKLNYTDINSNCSIINYIKQFQDDYLMAINSTSISKFSHINKSEAFSEEKSFKSTIPPNIKKKIKNELFIKKYSKKCKMTWKKNNVNSLNISKIHTPNKNSQISIKTNSFVKIRRESTRSNFNGDLNLYMEIKKIIIKQELLGYYFYLSKIKNTNYNNMSYILDNNNINNDKNNKLLTKLKKYQCVFKSKEVDEYNKYQLKKGSKFTSLIVNASKKRDKDRKEISQYRKKERKKSLDKKSKVGFKVEDRLNHIKNSHLSSKNNLFENDNYTNSDNFILTDNFIPDYSSYFLIDLKKSSFIPEIEIDKQKEFVEILKGEADNKIKIYEEQLKILGKDSEYSSNESEEYENESDFFTDNSKSKLNSSESFSNSLYESIRPKNTKTNNSEKISKKTTKILKIKSDIQNTDSSMEINKAIIFSKKIQKKNSIINSFYKVNLSNIKYMIFDFYKDMIVEGDKKEIVSKIETIMINSKNLEPIDYDKDERFSFFTLFKNKNKKNNKENKDNKENNETIKKNNINTNIKSNIREEKIFKKKIYEALNNHKNEPPIIRLKLFSILSYFVMFIYEFISTILSIICLSKISKVLYLIKNTIIIKYCGQISVYYLREISLLNIEIKEIKDGFYLNFPAKTKDDYIDLIREEIMGLFTESQSSMKILFSSSLPLDYNSSQILSEYTLRIKMSQDPPVYLNYNILTALMQYTSSFYNLAFTVTPITQNHSDLNNYIYNNLNDYKKGFNILIDIYSNELDNYLDKILKLSYIFIAIILVFFCVVYFFIIKNFLSAIQTRGNYMKAFYGINQNILKNLIANCENLLLKLKTKEEKKNHEEESLIDSIEDKMNIEENPKIQKINSQNLNLNYGIENQENNKASFIGIMFLIVYGIFFLISYIYYIYICIYMINISKKTIFLYQFCLKIENYQLGIIEFFNVYREFLFDNQSIINNLTSLDYLIKYEREELPKIYEYVNYINLNFETTLSEYENDTNKTLCSYYINDFFDSIVDCEEVIGLISTYDFDTLAYNFFEEIKINKNIMKYILKNGIDMGDLPEFNYTDYINNELFQINDDDYINNINYIFRLSLFNNETIHAYLNKMFFSTILPFIEFHREHVYNILNIDGRDTYLIIINVLFRALVTLVFLCYFLPVINFINSIIYKTKNMLSIIPLNILSLQSGVANLLRISNEK